MGVDTPEGTLARAGPADRYVETVEDLPCRGRPVRVLVDAGGTPTGIVSDQDDRAWTVISATRSRSGDRGRTAQAWGPLPSGAFGDGYLPVVLEDLGEGRWWLDLNRHIS